MSQSITAITQHIGIDSVVSNHTFRGENTITVTLEKLHDALRFCKEKLAMQLLLDICSVDFPDESPRFMLVYELSTLHNEEHIRVKAAVEIDQQVPTASNIWKAADWHEREVYDMMGISFAGHPDMSRILMWENYPYHPLRKEFPLAGIPTEVPDIASTNVAPMEGGPFITSPTACNSRHGEPQAKGES